MEEVDIIRRYLFTALFSLSLVACGTTSKRSENLAELMTMELPDAFPGAVQEDFPVKDIFALTEQQKEAFFVWFNAPERADIAAHQRLYNYLDMRLSGFDYPIKIS